MRALELGMVNRVVGAGLAEKEALSTSGEIASRGPLAVRAAKRAIDEGLLLVSSLHQKDVGFGGTAVLQQ